MKDGLTAEDLRWLHSLDLAISICTRMEELGLSKNEVAERAGMKASALSRRKEWVGHVTRCSRPQATQGTLRWTRWGSTSIFSSERPQGHLMPAGAAARANTGFSAMTVWRQWGQI